MATRRNVSARSKLSSEKNSRVSSKATPKKERSKNVPPQPNKSKSDNRSKNKSKSPERNRKQKKKKTTGDRKAVSKKASSQSHCVCSDENESMIPKKKAKNANIEECQLAGRSSPRRLSLNRDDFEESSGRDECSSSECVNRKGTPASSYRGKEKCKADAYTVFARNIIKDVLRYRAFTPCALRTLTYQHFKRNQGKLDKSKMIVQVRKILHLMHIPSKTVLLQHQDIIENQNENLTKCDGRNQEEKRRKTDTSVNDRITAEKASVISLSGGKKNVKIFINKDCHAVDISLVILNENGKVIDSKGDDCGSSGRPTNMSNNQAGAEDCDACSRRGRKNSRNDQLNDGVRSTRSDSYDSECSVRRRKDRREEDEDSPLRVPVSRQSPNPSRRSSKNSQASQACSCDGCDGIHGCPSKSNSPGTSKKPQSRSPNGRKEPSAKSKATSANRRRNPQAEACSRMKAGPSKTRDTSPVTPKQSQKANYCVCTSKSKDNSPEPRKKSPRGSQTYSTKSKDTSRDPPSNRASIISQNAYKSRRRSMVDEKLPNVAKQTETEKSSPYPKDSPVCDACNRGETSAKPSRRKSDSKSYESDGEGVEALLYAKSRKGGAVKPALVETTVEEEEESEEEEPARGEPDEETEEEKDESEDEEKDDNESETEEKPEDPMDKHLVVTTDESSKESSSEKSSKISSTSVSSSPSEKSGEGVQQAPRFSIDEEKKKLKKSPCLVCTKCHKKIRKMHQETQTSDSLDVLVLTSTK